jgi:hypothetical protein
VVELAIIVTGRVPMISIIAPSALGLTPGAM